MPRAAGTVLELRRWPVKSAGGEQVGALRIDRRGVAGDRTHALHRGGRRVTAREAPRLLGWQASYGGADVDPAAPPAPALTAPDGRSWSWEDPALAAAFADFLGREVELVRDAEGQQDVGETVTLTTVATLRALEDELGMALDIRRFRPNVHAELDAPAWAEHAWPEGTRVRIGEAELEVFMPIPRCAIPTRDPDTFEKAPRVLRHLAREHDTLFGVALRPPAAARLRVGDPVAVA